MAAWDEQIVRRGEPQLTRHSLIVMDTQPQPNETNQPASGNLPEQGHTALCSPSHLIATIPGSLGYFPNESVVLINVYSHPAADQALDIGTYLDADVGNTESIQRALQLIPVGRHVATFAVIVTRVPDSQMVAVAVEGLRRAADEFGEIVEACWIVSEVADGTPYHLVFGPGICSARNLWGWDDTYQCGTVSSIVAAEPMRPLIDQGALPELHKDELFAHFDPVSTPDARKCQALAPSAYRQGGELMDLVDVAPALARERLERACDIFFGAPNTSVIDNDGSLIIADVFTCAEDVELLASVLSRNALRDCLIVDALNHPRAAAAVLLTIARNFSGRIRANALCLWAMVAVSLGLTGWASAALASAQMEVPGHSLSGLLASVLGIGQGHALLELCRQGCADTWAGLEG